MKRGVCEKVDGGISICLDLSRLNENVKETGPSIPRVELTFAEIGSARMSKLDMNSGFYQLNLASECRNLSYRWNLLGIWALPKMPIIASSRLQELLHYWFGVGIRWNTTCFRAGLKKIQEAEMTLNKEKIELKKKHSSSSRDSHYRQRGLYLTLAKLRELPTLTGFQGVQRLMGMVNFRSCFIPDKSEILEPIEPSFFVWGATTRGSDQENQVL